ncbi:universal stress protein [Sulfitobacter guttiformis]|uniref:Nucleotide-binding universal stress UspA family protein n=1 Tax=Sulfitobacter guttiformis TaxID=74349 RepID=A0A420DJ62_9RHOB|nr:universal stress protein [Sulfitobacter guttiformis]KIN71938.1 UspA protein [Sulfitobacter guttiformis KCTC 32187]RKE94259.1 nucleotide-binding universal stress UspA family protein [Sulfitobacter guttiformis]
MFKRIVVGLDGSDTSEKALRVACDLALKYGSELHLVHTPQPQPVAFAMGAVAGYHAVTTMPSAEEVKTAGEMILNSGTSIVEKLKCTVTGAHLGQGDPADNIMHYAKNGSADLIVTGRRGLGVVGALVAGSTSQRINHHAECACLSVI